MNRFVRLVAAVAVASTIASTSALAGDYTLGDLTIKHAWSRATAPGAPTGAGFMSITNTGSAADTLISAAAPFAGRTELHQMAMENDVMRMREVDGGIEIAPGATVELKPGGLHVMFMGLGERFKDGENRAVTLTFENAGEITVDFAVKAMGEGAGDRSGHGKKHGS